MRTVYRVPWTKELARPFHCGPRYVLFSLCGIAFCLLMVALAVSEGMAFGYLGLVVLIAGPVALLVFLPLVWRLSIRFDSNTAVFADGAVRVRKAWYRDPVTYGPAVFGVMYIGQTMAMVDFHVLGDTDSGRLAFLSHPVVNVVLLVFWLVYFVRFLTVKPMGALELVFSPERVRIEVGRLNLLDIPWDDIVDIWVGKSGVRGEQLLTFMYFRTHSEYEVKRGILLDPIAGETRFDL